MSFSSFFQCFSWISECCYLIKHQDQRTTTSVSSWSVEWDHQDVRWAKRSTRHDFEMQQALNRSTSQTYSETETAKDQSHHNEHFKRD